MPISDYANAIFFVRRNRVTLPGVPRVAFAISKACPIMRRQDCRGPQRFHMYGFLHTIELQKVKIPTRKNFARHGSMKQDVRKKKKPGTAGLFDEYLFRSVHFASLAI
jgi:hypothetical protein